MAVDGAPDAGPVRRHKAFEEGGEVGLVHGYRLPRAAGSTDGLVAPLLAVLYTSPVLTRREYLSWWHRVHVRPSAWLFSRSLPTNRTPAMVSDACLPSSVTTSGARASNRYTVSLPSSTAMAYYRAIGSGRRRSTRSENRDRKRPDREYGRRVLMRLAAQSQIWSSNTDVILTNR